MRISNLREPLCVVKIDCLICPKAAVPRCYWFWVLFLKVSQNLQENARAEVSFNEVTGLQPGTLLKRGCHEYFPVNLGEFLRDLFLQTSPGDCFLLLFLVWEVVNF